MDDLGRLPATEVAGQVAQRGPGRCEQQHPAQEQRQRGPALPQPFRDDRGAGELEALPCLTVADADHLDGLELDLRPVDPQIKPPRDLHQGLLGEGLGHRPRRDTRSERDLEPGGEAARRIGVPERHGRPALRHPHPDDPTLEHHRAGEGGIEPPPHLLQ